MLAAPLSLRSNRVGVADTHVREVPGDETLRRGSGDFTRPTESAFGECGSCQASVKQTSSCGAKRRFSLKYLIYKDEKRPAKPLDGFESRPRLQVSLPYGPT